MVLTLGLLHRSDRLRKASPCVSENGRIRPGSRRSGLDPEAGDWTAVLESVDAFFILHAVGGVAVRIRATGLLHARARIE